MDEFGVFVFVAFLVVLGIFLLIGRYYPGSGAEQVDWKLTRSPELEAELELDDVDQMLEAQNARRRATGRPEITEEDVQERLREDELRARSEREGADKRARREARVPRRDSGPGERG